MAKEDFNDRRTGRAGNCHACNYRFSLVLYRMGALHRAGTLSAVAASIAIAVILFWNQ
ncbi:hypothetical protein HED49_13575 [Ochrobactrum daejeonense]|nr:hypothetical protein [Brucella daejeonensis]